MYFRTYKKMACEETKQALESGRRAENMSGNFL